MVKALGSRAQNLQDSCVNRTIQRRGLAVNARSPARTSRLGFTLIEIIIVIGIMGVLATIVIIAISPAQQLEDARNAERKIVVREAENAALQYAIDHWDSELGAGAVPTGETQAKKICRAGITQIGCVNLDALVPDYLSAIPVDNSEQDTLVTGYRVYKDQLGKIRVCSDYLSGNEACEGGQQASSSSSLASSSAQAATDVTAQVTIARGGPVFNRSNNTWSQTVTITNVSGTAIPGGFRFVAAGISSGAAITAAQWNAQALTVDSSDAGNPRVLIPYSLVNALAPSAVLNLSFTLTGTTFNYTSQLFSTGQ